VRITVTTETGHKAELSTTTAVDGRVLARASGYWRGVRTPALDLFVFDGEDAKTRAERYLRRLAAALVDRDALEEAS
jgi:hypothetical protein